MYFTLPVLPVLPVLPAVELLPVRPPPAVAPLPAAAARPPAAAARPRVALAAAPPAAAPASATKNVLLFLISKLLTGLPLASNTLATRVLFATQPEILPSIETNFLALTLPSSVVTWSVR